MFTDCEIEIQIPMLIKELIVIDSKKNADTQQKEFKSDSRKNVDSREINLIVEKIGTIVGNNMEVPPILVKLVTSLQALLRKAFRSPGDMFRGDFGIFCLIFSRTENASLVLPKLGMQTNLTIVNQFKFDLTLNRKFQIGRPILDWANFWIGHNIQYTYNHCLYP